MEYCNNCGTQLVEGAKFCSGCGAPVAPAAPVREGITVRSVYARSFALLAAKPLRLWGVSLMCTLLTALASAFAVLPILSMPIVFVLTAGMKAVYLAGIRGEEVQTDHLFVGFKSFLRLACGMGWMSLWVLIWSLIPVAGIVMGVIKSYSYRFTPYILMHDPDISVTDALRKSMEMTEGLKGRMFGADILIIAGIFVASLLLALLAQIPFAGILFAILLVIFLLIVLALSPLLFGIIEATFYDEKERK